MLIFVIFVSRYSELPSSGATIPEPQLPLLGERHVVINSTVRCLKLRGTPRPLHRASGHEAILYFTLGGSRNFCHSFHACLSVIISPISNSITYLFEEIPQSLVQMTVKRRGDS